MLQLRALKLALETADGPFGFHVAFAEGLTVIRADNTTGKSTCLNAIVYALGLEGMFGPSHRVPLADVVCSELEWDSRKIAVSESRVFLEISNAKGRVVTLARAITGETAARQVVRVYMGPEVSTPGSKHEWRDLFVRIAGAAQSDLGLHTFLCEFLGIELPRLQAATGKRVPLYLECVLPFFFVDQFGWRDIKARMPTHLGIPHMIGRACEFVMDLDVLRQSIQIQDLEESAESIRTQWREQVAAATAATRGVGSVVVGLTREPPSAWPQTPGPRLEINLRGEWLVAAEAVRAARAIATAAAREEQSTDAGAVVAVAELRRLEEQLDLSERRAREETLAIKRERDALIDIEKRIADLHEDLRQHEDELKLLRRGGQLPAKHDSETCILCQQPLPETLVGFVSASKPMTVEENVSFLRDQIATFAGMSKDIRRALEAHEAAAVAANARVAELAALVREQQKTVRADPRLPDITKIRTRIQAEELANVIESAAREFTTSLDALAPLAERWVQNQAALRELRKAKGSEADGRKLRKVGLSYLDQLRTYEFSSYQVDELEINDETYRPSLHGRDMGLTSASDAIRSIWAYHIALLELARTEQTKHFGFLVFDEARQQAVDNNSYRAMLARVATARHAHQQVIVSTSHEKAELQELLSGIDYTYVPYGGRLIRPVVPAPRVLPPVSNPGDASQSQTSAPGDSAPTLKLPPPDGAAG